MADETHDDIGYADSERRALDCGNDLEDIGQREIINIDISYQPRWDQQKASGRFTRTGTILYPFINAMLLVSPRKDGIMCTNEIVEEDFKVERSDRNNKVLFPV
jgi:hypothetical protein